MVALSVDRQKYYDDLFEMFSSEGWKLLIKDLEETKENLEYVLTYTDLDWDNILKNRGQLQSILTMINLESTVEQLYMNEVESLKMSDALEEDHG